MKKFIILFIVLLLILIFLLPLFFLFLQIFDLNISIFEHLIKGNLFYYIYETIILIILVIFISSIIAIPMAFLLARYKFFASNYLEWLVCLPLAIPTYLSAYVITDLFDYAGIVQQFIRYIFNFTKPSDYYFPPIRSIGGAALVLSLCLYPYLYLITRNMFMNSHEKLVNSSYILSSSKLRTIKKIILPLAKPSIAIGLLLICMEVIGDYGAVSFFSIHTMTTAIYDSWLGLGSLPTAIAISIFLLIMILSIILIENWYRRKEKYYSRNEALNIIKIKLIGYKSFLAFIFCFIIFFMAFLIPVGRLTYWAIINFWENINIKFFEYITNSIVLSASASISSLIIALLLQYLFRNSQIKNLPYKSIYNSSIKITSLGYAIPGVILAIGLITPLIQIDFFINYIYNLFYDDRLGLIVSGTMFALVLAYTLRFTTLTQGTISAAMTNINPNIDMASASLGANSQFTFFKIYLPVLRVPILTSLMLVFIESMKELNATLLLRPFNFETLATHLYSYTSDELLEHSALSAIILILVSTISVIILTKSLIVNNKRV